MRLFTVGYECLSQAQLAALANRLDATVVDVRSRPSGRVKRGFDRASLAALLPRYVWRGDVLGGMGRGVQPEGLAWLRAQPGALLLLCKEEAPGDCHRHHQIAVPFLQEGIDARHIYRAGDSDPEIILASEIEAEGDYDADLACARWASL